MKYLLVARILRVSIDLMRRDQRVLTSARLQMEGASSRALALCSTFLGAFWSIPIDRVWLPAQERVKHLDAFMAQLGLAESLNKAIFLKIP